LGKKTLHGSGGKFRAKHRGSLRGRGKRQSCSSRDRMLFLKLEGKASEVLRRGFLWIKDQLH